MKALPMLDHVMLWIARFFAVVALGYLLFVCWGISSDFYSEYQQLTLRHRPWPWQRGGTDVPVLIFLSVHLIASIPWNLSLWTLHKDITRLYLGLSSGLMFFIGAYHMVDGFMHGPKFVNWWNVPSLIGFGAMIWVSIRLPQSRPGDYPSNPNNLVIPV